VNGRLLVGAGLVTLGAVLLANNLLATDLPVGPVLLVMLGLLVIATALRAPSAAASTGGVPSTGAASTVTGEPGAPAEIAELALEGAASARLVLNHGAGTLRIASGARDGLLYRGSFAGGVRQEVVRGAAGLDVTLRPARDDDWWLRRVPITWELQLGDEVPIDLEVRTGAARLELDLTGAPVRSLVVKTGASEVSLVLPDHGRTTTAISAGAADVRVTVPAGVAAAVRNRSALAGFSVDENRFPRADGGFRSPGYDDAEDRAEIEIDGGIASFTIR
jgi:hypothetical protein